MISIVCEGDEIVETSPEVAYYIADVKNAIFEMFPESSPVILKKLKSDYLKIVVYLLEVALNGSSSIVLPAYVTKCSNAQLNCLHISALPHISDLMRYLGKFAQSAKHFHVDIDWKHHSFTVLVRRKERTGDN